MNFEYIKCIAAFGLCFVTFLCSMLPLLLTRRVHASNSEITRPNYSRIISFLSCFGGGVFLGTCLLDLFPDVRVQMTNVFKMYEFETDYPVAEFLLAFGFLTVLLMEQIVHDCKQQRRTTDVDISHDHDISFHQQSDEESPLLSHQHYHGENSDVHLIRNYGTESHERQTTDVDISFDHDKSFHPQSSEESSLLSHRHSHHGENSDIQIIQNCGTESHERQNNAVDVSHDHDKSFHQDQRSHSILRSVFLVLALSLHSVFEGLAIGLQPLAESMVRILLAVLIHKTIIAFTLGLNLANSKLGICSIVRLNGLFSLTSPIGMIIGTLVVDAGEGPGVALASGVLQGMAAGTFLYVTFFEILPHELNSNKDKMLKMASLIVGFSVISMLIIYMPG